MKTTGEDIFKALENVDEHYIEECQQSGSGVKIKTVWKKWVAVAACGVIATVTGEDLYDWGEQRAYGQLSRTKI